MAQIKKLAEHLCSTSFGNGYEHQQAQTCLSIWQGSQGVSKQTQHEPVRVLGQDFRNPVRRLPIRIRSGPSQAGTAPSPSGLRP